MKKVKHVCRRCGFLSVFAAGPVDVVKCARCGEIQGVEQPLQEKVKCGGGA